MDSALAFVVYLLVPVALIGSGIGSTDVEPASSTPRPNRLGDQIVGWLMAQLRDRGQSGVLATTERLQREMDER